MLGLTLTALWAVGLVMAVLAPGLNAVSGPGHPIGGPWPTRLVTSAGLALSGLLFVSARRLHHRPQVLLDLSLVFQVAFGLLVALLGSWRSVAAGGLSPLVAIILIFPMIAPNSAPKILAASLLTATMDPIAFGIALARGADLPPEFHTMAWRFVPTYAMAVVAVLPAQIIRHLGRQVRTARELGSYRLGERIGSGGMGEVYHAEHRLLVRPAAIKLVKPELLGAVGPRHGQVVLERFRREAQVTASLRSPHTVGLYDFGLTEDGTFYLVMELLDGLSLEELVKRFGPLPPERAAHLVAQACASLAEAHHRGMVHRDVKPSNLFTTRNGLDDDFVKVLDFGLVKGEPDPGSAQLTAPQTATGTPAYMAPELALGEPIDGRTDVYALGCVLTWLVTGRLVFEASSPGKMMHLHVTEPPAPPSARTELAVPPEFDAVALACLAKDPARRPATATELAARLTAIPFASPWNGERARRWWATHVPESTIPRPCNQGRIAPALATR
jgi:serine/threonine-protein kinase